MAPKDLFSTQAADYSKFRPTYPPELFAFLAKLVPDHSLVWDCGTGNGQAAVALAKYFDRVYATDVSEKQLAAATPHANVEYHLGGDTKCALPDHSASLVTVAQALHWFHFEKFFAEVRRVAKKKDSYFAVWCYGLTRFSPEIDKLTEHLCFEVVGKFWEPEREHIDKSYSDISFPFHEVPAPQVEMKWPTPFDQWIGYLNTWSAVQTGIKKTGQNLLEPLVPAFRQAWGDPAKPRVGTVPLTFRTFSVST